MAGTGLICPPPPRVAGGKGGCLAPPRHTSPCIPWLSVEKRERWCITCADAPAAPLKVPQGQRGAARGGSGGRGKGWPRRGGGGRWGRGLGAGAMAGTKLSQCLLDAGRVAGNDAVQAVYGIGGRCQAQAWGVVLSRAPGGVKGSVLGPLTPRSLPHPSSAPSDPVTPLQPLSRWASPCWASLVPPCLRPHSGHQPCPVLSPLAPPPSPPLRAPCLAQLALPR